MIDLSDIGVDKLDLSPGYADISLETLMSGNAMHEGAASVLPVGCCSCSIPCCCCC
ncbi:hypothetical protein [Spongiactinospora sp. TRM90649]|uniref:hypothetical protein n=1 Tax=Spongiactinospora sp. TRM90649 TaxID=3031114 RepID=UPI0023F932A2|nr:hypothetical protein [Spongiactinospora sp. TRM90649]MDF5756353.1 hypothetical protein [Spongiactinospora sp. TRM90649]